MISSSIGPCDQLLDLLSYQSFDLSVGYRQIKSVPMMLVMLSYSWLIPRAYTITSLVWPMLSPCSLNYGIPFKREPGWIVVEPIDNILISSMILLNIKLVLETCVSIFFMPRSWSICWMKEVTSSNSCAFEASCRREFEKVCFASSGIIPSQSCIRAKYSVVRRLATSILYGSLAHQATDWFVQD